MAESPEESLFQDVHNVQAKLESHFVVNYDANRIYDRLERHLNDDDRITIVVNEILDSIGAPLDMFGLPVTSNLDGDSSQDTEILDQSFISVISNPNDETVHLDSDDSNNDVHNDTQRPSDNSVPVIDQPEINNNDPNNNTDLGFPTVIRVPTREDVLNMEARQVCDIVPQISLGEIRSCLEKYEHVPDRVSVVVNLCINRDNLLIVPTINKESKAGCSYNEKSIQKKKHGVHVATVKDRAIKRIVEETNNLAEQLSTPSNIELVEDCSGTKKPNVKQIQQEEPYCGLPLGPIPAMLPTASALLKQPGKEEGSLLASAVQIPGLSTSNGHINYNVSAAQPVALQPKLQKQTNLPSAQGIAPVPDVMAGQAEPVKNNLVDPEKLIGTERVPVNMPQVDMPTVTDILADARQMASNTLTTNLLHAVQDLHIPDIHMRDTPHTSDPQRPGSSDKAAMGNPAGPALLKDTQPSTSKRKILNDPNGPVDVEEKKVKFPELKPEPLVPAVLPPHKYLNTIREMFPTVAVAYLQKCCYDLGKDDIGVVISHLLETPDLPQRVVPEPVADVPMNPKQLMASYQALQDILPDADPDYLRETWERVGNHQEDLKQFVADALENRNYPKLVDYQKRLKMAALLKKFTEEFSIEGFLEMFPDPFKHFENLQKNGQPTHTQIEGRSFLMARYPKIRCNDIDRCYRKHMYRLLETCQELDKITTGFMKSTRKNFEIPVYKTNRNLAFLQEIAFIENEAKIRQHIRDKADMRLKMFEEAKAKGELLSCGCCFDDEFLPEDMAACNEGHIFCKECIKKGAEVEIGKGKTDLPCLMDCGQMISLQTLKGILQPSVFIRLDQRKQIEEVKAAGIEDLETCPFCDFGTIPSSADKVFKCLNPDCMKESCRLCKELSHIPLRCDEVEKSEEVKLRTYIENRMTEALVRTCWKCKKKFIKEDGCNKMTCTCGALMCYLCRQPVSDYSHFNGQGGDRIDKCPLYSNNDKLHVDAVREEAKKAKEEVEAKNPQLALKHDPTLILPTAKAAPARGNPGDPAAIVNLQEEDEGDEDMEEEEDEMYDDFDGFYGDYDGEEEEVEEEEEEDDYGYRNRYEYYRHYHRRY